MEYNALYLVTEELITNTPHNTEDGRKTANLLYNGACYLLDRSIVAWYKTIPIQDRMTLSEDISPIGLLNKDQDSKIWVQQLKAILKVPWLLPIYSYKRGIEIDVSRRTLMDRLPACIVEDPPLPLHLCMRFSIPPPGVRLAGIAIYGYGIEHDDAHFDYVGTSLRREAYSSARTSVLEMGAESAHNIPAAGFVRASGRQLCPKGGAAKYSPWAFLGEGGLYTETPLYYWSRIPLRMDRKTVQDIKAVLEISKWSTEEQAVREIEILYYQLFAFPSWNYMLSRIDLNVEEPFGGWIPNVVVAPIGPPLAPRKPIENVGAQNAFIIGLSIPNIRKLVRGVPILEAFRKVLSDGALSTKWARSLGKFKAIPHDMARIKYFLSLITKVRQLESLDSRRRILDKIRRETALEDHFYRDILSGSILFCEHVFEEMVLLSKGSTDLDELQQKYVRDRSTLALGGLGVDFDDVRTFECRYCGADLGSIWFVTTPTEETFASIAETPIAEDDFNNIIYKLVQSGALETELELYELTSVVRSLVELPMMNEIKRLARSDPTERLEKEKLIVFSSIVAGLHALEVTHVPLRISVVKLEKFLSKEYVDTLRIVGQLPAKLIQRMLTYWGTSLSKYYTEPIQILNNCVMTLLGSKVNTQLIRHYIDLNLYPMRLYGYTKAARKVEQTDSMSVILGMEDRLQPMASIKNAYAKRYAETILSPRPITKYRPVSKWIDAIYWRSEQIGRAHV